MQSRRECKRHLTKLEPPPAARAAATAFVPNVAAEVAFRADWRPCKPMRRATVRGFRHLVRETLGVQSGGALATTSICSVFAASVVLVA